MRAISLVNHIEFDFTGNVVRKGLTLGDVDNDGNNELIVGGESGEVAIFKGEEKWLTISGLSFISCVAVGDILNLNKNCLIIITADGWCHIYCCVAQMVSTSDSSDSHTEDKTDEGGDQVDGQIFSSESIESEKSTSSESAQSMSQNKEKIILKRLHLQRIPANSKDILLGDIDGDGCIEMVLGLTDRVVRSYRWYSNIDYNSSQDVFENISGRLVGINKWECAKQIGSVTLHHSKDGIPTLLVAQPGGTFMRIICQQEEPITQSTDTAGEQSDSGSSRSDNLLGSKIDYQFLGISRMRNQNISTEILGNFRTELEKTQSDDEEAGSSEKTKMKGNSYAVATLDGTIMFVHDEVILWAIAVDHQIFALAKMDVTGNGKDDIVACSWDGHTYILDQDKNSVRFQLDESVQAFECGYYNLSPDWPPVTCFIYITFKNKIYLYYDIPLKNMICKKFEPDLAKFKDILVDDFPIEKNDPKIKRQLVEYLLYGVEKV